jgi:hypothetical protein
MLQGYNGLRGWATLAVLVPVAFVLTYVNMSEVRRASFWGDDWRGRPLEERIHILPADAVASLRDELSGRRFASPVAPAGAAAYVLAALRAAVAQYPERDTRLASEHLIGVFLV